MHRLLNMNEWPAFFRWPALPPLLYVASSACVLAGIFQIVVPVYDQELPTLEKYWAYAASHAYELAMLTVVLLILRRSSAVDDSAALVLLIGGFIVGGAVLVDPVTRGTLEATIGIAVAALVLAGFKLAALHRFVLRLEPALLVVLGVLAVWNFTMPAVLAAMIERDALDDTLTPAWLVGWDVTLVCGAALVTFAVALGRERVLIAPAFVHSRLMRYLFVAVVLGASLAHQYAIVWAFALPIRLGDFLPAYGIAALTAVALWRAHARTVPVLEASVLGIPLLAAMVVLADQSYTQTVYSNLGLVSYPPVFAGAMSAAVFVMGMRWRDASLHVIAGAYLAVAILTFGADPHLHREVSSTNLSVAALALGAALFAASVAYRRAFPGLIAAVLLAAAAIIPDQAQEWAQGRRLEWWDVFVATLGAVLVLEAIALRSFMPRIVGTAGLTLLALAVMHACFPPASGLHHPVIASAAILSLAGVAAWWTRNWRLLVPGGLPGGAGVAGFLIEHGAWAFVLAGFVILAIGAAMSLSRQNGRGRHVPAQGDTAAN